MLFNTYFCVLFVGSRFILAVKEFSIENNKFCKTYTTLINNNGGYIRRLVFNSPQTLVKTFKSCS